MVQRPRRKHAFTYTILEPNSGTESGFSRAPPRQTKSYSARATNQPGRSHTIEIWFALHEQTLYMLSGGRDKSDWVKNALQNPAVQVKINSSIFTGTARLVTGTEEDTLARRIVFEKYMPRTSVDLVEWSRTSLPIAVDFAR